jgi:hypothetical protein
MRPTRAYGLFVLFVALVGAGWLVALPYLVPGRTGEDEFWRYTPLAAAGIALIGFLWAAYFWVRAGRYDGARREYQRRREALLRGEDPGGDAASEG